MTITKPTAFSALLLATWLCVGACALGCDEDDKDKKRSERGPLVVNVEGEPIARVGGAIITDTQLDAAMRRAPQGTDRAVVLRNIIEQEVLAREAERRGFDTQPRVLLIKRRAMVQRLLEELLEQEIRPELISDEVLKNAYESFSIEFFVPEMVTASHLLLMLDEEHQTPDRLEKVRALAETLRATLGPTPTVDDLRHAARHAALLGYPATADANLTFPRHEIAPLAGEPVRYRAMVEPFAAAAFSLSKEAPLSGPITTQFGVHLVLFHARAPTSRPPFEAVKDRIRQDLTHRARRARLEHLFGDLQKELSIETDSAPIETMAGRASKMTSERPAQP